MNLGRLGLGCAPLGNLFTEVSDEDSVETIDAAWRAGIRFFDTAPLYGNGCSERRLGEALAKYQRTDFVLASKVGKLLRPIHGEAPATVYAGETSLMPVPDFSHDGVLRSIEESLVRLGLDRLDIVHVHDPDDHENEALEGAFPALVRLRDEGVIGAVGCGMNQAAMLSRFVDRVDLDCVLLAGRYSLLDRTGADELLPWCMRGGVQVIIGGVFNSGLLVDPDVNQMYDYAPARHELVVRAKQMRDACHRFGVSLSAAAIQFPLQHAAVTSVVVGARSALEIETDVEAAGVDIPRELWNTLLGL